MARKKDKARVVPPDPRQSRLDSSTDYQEAPAKVNPSDLVKLARDALQEKRLRNCLTLTAAILKIDPDNKDAHVIESWVYADLEQEFKTAVRLAEAARREHNRATWAGVQTSLRRILNVLPDHEGAKNLLAEALSSSHVPEPAPEAFPDFNPSPAPVLGYESAEKSSTRKVLVAAVLLLVLGGGGYLAFKRFQPVVGATPGSVSDERRGMLTLQADDGLQIFIDSQYRGTAPMEPLALPVGTHKVEYKANGILIAQEEIEVPINGTATNTLVKLVGRLDLLLVPTTGVELSIDGGPAAAAPEFILLKPGAHQLSFTAEGRSPEVRNITVTAGDRSLLPVLLREQPALDAREQKNTPPAPADVPPDAGKKADAAKKADAGTPPAPPPRRVAQPRGLLSITSSVPAQIYGDGRLLGITPATLEFPEGNQTLEYRYENLSKKMTHTVTSGETTAVNVVIDTALQINAQPWAEVFIQDGKNSSLGQTPLSGVRVPVGSTLIFRNPKFSDKLYRVSAKDTTVSVNFP